MVACVHGVRHRGYVFKDAYAKNFSTLDANQDQALSAREFCQDEGATSCKPWLKLIDTDGNGWLSFVEFYAYFEAKDPRSQHPVLPGYKQGISDLYDALDRNDNQELGPDEVCRPS